MNEIMIFTTVALITILISVGYGIFYFTKLISNQKHIEKELKDIIYEVEKRCSHR